MSHVAPTAEAGLDGPAVATWLVAAGEALGNARAELDDINVFPVADGDTGTNLALTTAAVADAVRRWAAPMTPGELPAASDAASAGDVAAAAAEAALLGARGNSGVILAAWLRGFAAGVGTRPVVDGATLASALSAASDGATAAVGRPLEGTILTVARAAAGGAAAGGASRPMSAMDAAAGSLAAARVALAGTTAQLPVLRAAGVVDAGGAGLVVLLEALAGVPRVSAARSGPSDEVERQPSGRPPPARRSGRIGGPPRTSQPGQFGEGVPAGAGQTEPAYEVMYLLDAPAESVAALESVLGALGDSLVVSGRPGRYRVHVHVDDVGAAIEAAIEVGRPSQIVVTRFADQVGPERAFSADPGAGRAVIAMVHGAGLSPLLAAAGATVVEGSGLGAPSTAEVLHAIRGTGAAEVLVLPNDTAAASDAEAAAASARAEGRSVRVVPTRSVMQALAALAVHDPDQPFADDAVGMTASARSTRSGEVMIAVSDALTSAGVCAPGQALGLIEGDVVLIANDVDSAASELLDRLLLGGGELVTLVTGPGAPAGLVQRLEARLRSTRPSVEMEVHDGGQGGHPLLVGVE